MKLGANEPKKLLILGGLLAVAAFLKFSDVLSSSGAGPVSPNPAPVTRPALPSTGDPQPPRTVPRAPGRRLQNDEFRPVLHSNRPEDRIPPEKIDPTLRLDLLAKLQEVEAQGPGRNLFQFGPPPVKALPPEPKVLPKPVPLAAAEPPKPAAPPPPPPIPLRYYGFSSAPGDNGKTAFFLDGEDILVGKEGETLKRRYRVVRIGVNSAVLEDTESKHQQTLPLEEIAG